MKRGNYHFKKGNYKKAIENFSRVLVVEPENKTALERLVKAYDKKEILRTIS